MNRTKFVKIAAPVGIAFSSIAAPAFAEGSTTLIDFSSLATAVQTDVTGAITAMLPFLGLLCGAVVGWRIFRKFTGARP